MDVGRDESALIEAAQAGDAEAFEELARRIRDRIFWIARQVVGNTEDAKDVSQNVLIRLWKVLPRYDKRYAFSTWMYRMTVNLAIDHLRRQAPRQRDTELDETFASDASTTSPTERIVADHEVARILDELRDCLPPQQRAVFALRELDGRTSDEVAEILSVSASTVRNHLFQARRTLRRELEKRYPEYAPRGDEATGKARSKGAAGKAGSAGATESVAGQGRPKGGRNR